MQVDWDSIGQVYPPGYAKKVMELHRVYIARNSGVKQSSKVFCVWSIDLGALRLGKH